MRALAIIAAALLSGHHHVQQTGTHRAYLVTGIQCQAAAPLHGVPTHVRCIHGRIVVTQLRLGHAQTQFGTMRQLAVYSHSGALQGWVDWRLKSITAGNVRHDIVGLFNWRKFTMTWTSS